MRKRLQGLQKVSEEFASNPTSSVQSVHDDSNAHYSSPYAWTDEYSTHDQPNTLTKIADDGLDSISKIEQNESRTQSIDDQSDSNLSQQTTAHYNERPGSLQRKNQRSQKTYRYGKNRIDPEVFFSYEKYTPPKKLKVRPIMKPPPKKFIPGRYIRATYRLYIDPSSDIFYLLTHPDQFVNWNIVQKVDIICNGESDFVVCPICLDNDLTAPRITRCGHVFCFPCILRSLDAAAAAMHATKHKCPVCSEPVTMVELKPARFQIVRKPEINSVFSFRLMIRQHDPVPTVYNGGTLAASVFSSHPEVVFHRLAILAPDNQLIEEDFKSLESKRSECQLNKDEQYLHSVDDCLEYLLLNQVEDASPNDKHDVVNHDKIAESRGPSKDQHSSKVQILSSTPSSYPLVSPSKTTDQSESSPCYFFYQLVDGQLAILSESDTKCFLEDAKGVASHQASLGPRRSSLLAHIENAKVLWVEEETVDVAFRKRYPHLSHLPQGTVVSFLEIDLEPFISQPVRAQFESDIKHHRNLKIRKLRRKAKEDDLRSAKLEAMQSTEIQLRLLADQQRLAQAECSVDLPGLPAKTMVADTELFPPLEPLAAVTKNQWIQKGFKQTCDPFPALESAMSSSTSSAWPPPQSRADKQKAKISSVQCCRRSKLSSIRLVDHPRKMRDENIDDEAVEYLVHPNTQPNWTPLVDALEKSGAVRFSANND